MSRSKQITISVFMLFAILLAGLLACALLGQPAEPRDYSDSGRPAKIYPDYSSTVIPPNIAPLNFMVEEPGTYYIAKIYSEQGPPIKAAGRSSKIIIPFRDWHKLLDNNKGKDLHFDIFVRSADARWIRFATITCRIAGEGIDGYALYRRMPPTHFPDSGRVGIYQRDLSNFNESPILDHLRYRAGCVNCHTLWGNRPDKVLMGVRSDKYGVSTLLIEKDTVTRINAKFGYTTWHPNGRLAIFSMNMLPILFHTVGDYVIDTVDTNSALAYFDCGSRTTGTSPEFSKKENLETWPCWSGDGRYLYFCTTPTRWTGPNEIFPQGYDKIKYDLARISYDANENKWGKAETVLSSQQTGLSIAMPRVSPDNRWLVFCMCDYGYFPPWQQSSDLYIIDLRAAEQTGRFEYRRLDINSNQSEAWHSWSSNSRWLVFSSKREFGDFTKCYISYVDENGRVYKPFVLPQKDPEFYTYCLDAFNTPELATGPITVSAKQLAETQRGPGAVSVAMPITMATPKSDPMLE